MNINTIPISDYSGERVTVLDAVYKDVINYADSFYYRIICEFLERLKDQNENETRMFIDETRLVYKSKFLNSRFRFFCRPSGMRSKEAIRNYLFHTIHEFCGVRGDCNISYKEEIKTPCIIGGIKTTFGVPIGYNFEEEPEFRDFAEYTISFYLFEYLNYALGVFNNINNPINGKELFRILLFHSNCLEIARLFEETKKYKVSRLTRNLIKGMINSINNTLEYIDIRFYKVLLPYLDCLKNEAEKYPEFKDWDEIKAIIQLTDYATNAIPPQLSSIITEQEQPGFINNFDNIQPIDIYNHFKTGLVEKGYLTEEELNKYLKTAFELKNIPETLFKLKHTPKKQHIYTVFYSYYKDIAGKKHEQQTRYVELLGNYFEGYKTEIIKTNWAREYKAKR